MRESLKIIESYVLSVILPTIEQKVKKWVGLEIYQNLPLTEIEYNQRHVNNVLNCLHQNASLTISVPMFVQENGDTRKETNLWLTLNNK